MFARWDLYVIDSSCAHVSTGWGLYGTALGHHVITREKKVGSTVDGVDRRLSHVCTQLLMPSEATYRLACMYLSFV